MTFRMFLTIMSIASAAAWIGWLIILYGVDPSRSGSLGFVLFYVSLGIALIGTLSVLGVLVRLWTKQEGLVVILSMRSFRHALLLSTIFITSLIFLGIGMLRWWIVVGIVFIVSLIELIFLTSKKRSS
jgi:hypothetical protein